MLLAQRPLVEFTLAPLFEEHGIALAVMGVLVVFMALTLVVTFITILPHLLAGVASPEPAASAPAAPVALDSELPEELVVVIAAAVAATIVTPHRIVKIRGLTPSELGWSLEGRMQHHQSHGIRNRSR